MSNSDARKRQAEGVAAAGGAESDALREAAITAVHALEAVEPDPSVEQYVEAVFSVLPPGESS